MSQLVRDLRQAERVQRRLLPQRLPVVPGYGFFAYYRAAHAIGGDYFDFVPLPGNRLGIALGDVSGKAIAAALVMAKFSSDARHQLLATGAPAAAVTALNDAFCTSSLDESFMTLSVALLDPSSGRLQLCSAGHPPLLVRRAGGTVEALGEEAAGPPLGIVPGVSYEQTEVQLAPGDVVIAYSDDVTDAQNMAGELYDTRSNRRLLKRIQGTDRGPAELGAGILRAIRGFSRGQTQADDITLVCFGRRPW
jgi:serine phosphatase RsbU (regulator of sigma subunit)